MVFESIISPLKAENKPLDMLMLGAIYISLAALLSMWIFPSQASLIMIFLTVIACVPLMVGIITTEEKKDVSDFNEVVLLKEHSKALSAFMLLFIGITLAIALLYIVLPSTVVSQLFNVQIETISDMSHEIGAGVVGYASNSFSAFSNIFLNNMKVLMFCILFSFLYGAGAIFILTWNASVIGVAIGNFIRSNLATISHLIGFEKFASYFSIISIGLMKYVLHGVPEILAYFTAGLAGGIISIAVIRHDFQGKKFEHVVLDSADLILISIGLLFLAAILETWITPILF
ncbi:MAG: stage II sporulation protein M [Candidatus Woesearchaeota archaeon]